MKQNRRRNWVNTLTRISLRMTLVVVGVATIATAFVGQAWNQRQRELAFIERLNVEFNTRLVVDRHSANNLGLLVR